jgi:hypothetical protein
MSRKPVRRSKPLQPGAPPARRTALTRSAPLRPGRWRKPGTEERSNGRAPFAASEAQRAKILGAACVVCQQTKGITPAHLTPRSLGGCDHPDCVTALCWLHHRAFDTGQLELLPYLEPRWRAEIAHAVMHLGLIGALHQLGKRRD